MSWLEKIYKLFKTKEEAVETEHDMNLYETINQDKRGKDLDTRIYYQYPKGKFRFPIIPDKVERTTSEVAVVEPIKVDNQMKQEGRSRLSGQTRQERKSVTVSAQPRASRRGNQSDTKVNTMHEINEKNQSDLNNTMRPKVVKRSSRPFRPTEIPSPIYGFNKRPAQEIIEFELEDKTNVNGSHEPEVQLDYSEINTVMEEVKESRQVNGELKDQILDSASTTQCLPVLRENQLEDTFEPYTDEQIEIIEEDKLENKTIVNRYPEEEEVSEQILELQSEVNSDSSNLYNTEINNDSTSEPVTSRKHIPFNVLMLKQDKRLLEQKKNTVALKESDSSTSEHHNINVVQEEIEVIESDKYSNPDLEISYQFPGLDLLNPPMARFVQENRDWVDQQEQLLNEALRNFGVRASVVNITQGPSVTRFEVQPEPGVKVNKITNLSDDIKLSLAAKDIRIEAPIPGKHTIGIEVPNKNSRPVLISEIIQSEEFLNSASPLTAVLGLDISGAPVVTDLKKMPHGLIAGATGSGKSVCINSILVSLLYKASPHDLKLLLIDPKMVELAPYNHIPHLVSPVITDVKAATAALKWSVDEMERRYELFAHAGVRDINRFNEIAEIHKRYSEKLPFIVIIIDELADLMMMSPADVEESICRIAQKARACGIHLIIATQRPSVDVITGLIKANVPTRTAFSVSSQVDSRTIIDISGAEKLLGRGDMLFLENGSSKPVRLQGTFVSDAEIDLVVEHVREQQEPEYLFHQEELLKRAQLVEEEDELFYEACEFVIEQGGASTSSVQRRFKIGYNRAARLIDMMEKQGYISEPRGSKPRDVLITAEELLQIQETGS